MSYLKDLIKIIWEGQAQVQEKVREIFFSRIQDYLFNLSQKNKVLKWLFIKFNFIQMDFLVFIDYLVYYYFMIVVNEL